MNITEIGQKYKKHVCYDWIKSMIVYFFQPQILENVQFSQTLSRL